MSNRMHPTARHASRATAAAWLAVGLVAVAGWLALSFGPGFDVWMADAIATIRSWGRWGMLGSIALMVLHSFVPFPAELLACANGLIYGPLMGAAVTWVGAMLGACAAFGLARRFGRPLVLRMLSQRQAALLAQWTDRQGTDVLFLSRLVPVIAFNLVNYAAALAGFGWWAFLWTTALGILPMTMLTAVLGNQMLIMPPWVWGAVGAAAVLAGLLLHLLRHRGHA